MYLSFYELKDEPFRLTPDPRYLHMSEPHQAALTVLLEGILYRKGLVMITGPIGTGKTTLIHTALQLLTDFSKHRLPIRSALLFNPTLTRDEFLEMMLEEFEVPCTSTSKPRRLMALHQMLLETQRHGGTAVLFIDEAHLLSPELLEEIRLLGNADTHQEKLLQIALSGQPELVTMMNRRELSALQQRIAARSHLRPLSQAEVRAYVAERLHLAGLTGPSPFPVHTLDVVQRYSMGVPRLINLICDASLALGFRTQRRTIQPDVVEEVAVSLNLAEPAPVPEKKAPAVFAPGSDGAHKSIVDTLIETMRQHRATALE
ncbi:MAG TPA: AAA family ATPase [Methylomirabilota bacterium]|nr:AAA family ATPase [Methylomirabilota bacterium]